MNRNLYFILFLSLILTGCGVEESAKNTDHSGESLVVTYAKEIQASLQNHLGSLDTNYYQPEQVNRAYELTDVSAIWINDSVLLTPEGKQMVELLSHPEYYGLDSGRYNSTLIAALNNEIDAEADPLARLGNAITLELILTDRYFKFGKDIAVGVVDSTEYTWEFSRRTLDINFPEYLANASKADNLIGSLLNLQPKHIEYHQLQQGLQKFLSERAITDNSVNVRNYKEDSVKAYNEAREALVIHDYLDTVEVTDTLLMQALRAFQLDHGLTPDGVIGRNTAKALSTNPVDFYLGAAASLEKWRWTPEWEEEHIFANIATYKLKFYKENIKEQEHRIVVGKNLTKTPMLDSKIDHMIAYPFWHVPYSITSGELIPKMRKDSTYLARNGYKVLKGGKAVSHSSINWSTASASDFRIRQNGGGSNALGKIKFIFPNKHSVYFHDTPSKRFFANDIRAYSHGCMRVQDPMKLAEYILARESETMSIDTVQAFIDRKQRKKVSLNDKLAVHVRYMSVEGKQDSGIIFYPDIYGWEADLRRIIAGREPAEKPNS